MSRDVDWLLTASEVAELLTVPERGCAKTLEQGFSRASASAATADTGPMLYRNGC